MFTDSNQCVSLLYVDSVHYSNRCVSLLYVVSVHTIVIGVSHCYMYISVHTYDSNRHLLLLCHIAMRHTYYYMCYM